MIVKRKPIRDDFEEEIGAGAALERTSG